MDNGCELRACSPWLCLPVLAVTYASTSGLLRQASEGRRPLDHMLKHCVTWNETARRTQHPASASVHPAEHGRVVNHDPILGSRQAAALPGCQLVSWAAPAHLRIALSDCPLNWLTGQIQSLPKCVGISVGSLGSRSFGRVNRSNQDGREGIINQGTLTQHLSVGVKNYSEREGVTSASEASTVHRS